MVHPVRYLPILDRVTIDEAISEGVWDEAGTLVLALVAEASRQALPALQASCTARGLKLAGAVFPALIVESKFVKEGAWLVVVDATRAQLSSVAGREPQVWAREMADLVGSPGRPPTLFLVFDAMVPNVSTLLDALYLTVGDAVGYLGLCAGSETFQPIPCLFDGQVVQSGGVLAVVLDPGLLSVLAHGYRPPDESLTATATAGNKVSTIQWKPAFDVYRQQILRHYGVELTRENFYQYAVHFPVGLSLANGRTLVRVPVALDEEGALFCVGEVPENSLLTLLEAPAPGSEETVNEVTRALGPGGEPWPVFYCAGRRMHLGGAADLELTALAAASGSPAFGAVTLGEIGSFDESGYPLFHNGTIVYSRRDPARA